MTPEEQEKLVRDIVEAILTGKKLNDEKIEALAAEIAQIAMLRLSKSNWH